MPQSQGKMSTIEQLPKLATNFINAVNRLSLKGQEDLIRAEIIYANIPLLCASAIKLVLYVEDVSLISVMPITPLPKSELFSKYTFKHLHG